MITAAGPGQQHLLVLLPYFGEYSCSRPESKMGEAPSPYNLILAIDKGLARQSFLGRLCFFFPSITL
jgi:hypothetical protein